MRSWHGSWIEIRRLGLGDRPHDTLEEIAMTADHSPQDPPSTTAGTGPLDFAGSAHAGTPVKNRRHAKVPEAIERRYLRVDDRYLFPDRTLAFIDDGDRIRVRTENQAVLHSVAAIAQARGWRVLQVKGTEPFRRGMWREAARHGIEVRGYKPSRAEILQLQLALSKSAPSPETRQDARPSSASTERQAAPADHAPGRSIRGLLMAAAAAPYQFDPVHRMSFYILLRTEVGDRTVWGADLERALAESTSQPRIGDPVVLTQHATHPVKVLASTRNAAGKWVGEEGIVAQRARWSIETQDHLREMGVRARQVRAGQPLFDAAVDHPPELAAAAACLKLADRYAQRLTRDPSTQQRLVQLIRQRMADAMAQGRSIHLPARRLRPTPVHRRQRAGRDREEFGHERS